MTKQELQALKELTEKATPGPWYPCGCRYTMISRDLSDNEIEDVAEVCNHYRDESQIEFNKQFIAASRTAIPKLIDRIEKLEKALEKAKEQRDHYGDLAFAHTEVVDYIPIYQEQDNQEIDEMLR